MKDFLKNYLINIIFGMISFVLLLCAFMSLFDWIINPIFWVIESIFIALTFYLPKRNKGNNDGKKEFRLFTKYKVGLIIILILIAMHFLIIANNVSGWDGVGYAILFVVVLQILKIILVMNFIIRIYYRIKYKQIFELKEIIYGLIVIFICVYGSLITIK